VADAAGTLEAPVEVEPEAPVKAPPPPAKAEKPAKEKKGKKDGKKGKAEVLEADGPSVAGHPRAARSVERVKAWGALVGFGAGFYESLPTHTFAMTMVRAIVAGIALFLAGWAGSVFFWRRMVMVEINAREQQIRAAAQALQARRAAAESSQGPGR